MLDCRRVSIRAARHCVLFAAACAIWTACHREGAPDYKPEFGPAALRAAALPEYRLGVEPVPNTRRLWERYARLVAAINSNALFLKLRLESAQTPARYEAKLRDEALDIAFVEPHRVLELEKRGYRVFARTGRHDRISGLMVLRADSEVRSLRDLKGKTIAFGNENSLASTMLVRMWLRDSGFAERNARLMFLDSDQSALMQVYIGAADAAGTSRAGWSEFETSNPHAARALRARWRTEELSGPALMTHRRVPREHVQAIAKILAKLAETPAGQLAIEAAGYSDLRVTEPGSYDDVWDFMNTYARAFPARPNPAGGAR